MSDKVQSLLAATPTLLTNAAATVFTNVSGDETLVQQVRFANTSGATVTVNLSFGADSTTTRIVPGVSLTANSVLDHFFSPGIPLTGTQTLQAFASTTSVVNLSIWGTKRYV